MAQLQFLHSIVIMLIIPSEALTYFSVDKFGAKGDGLSDDTEAFLRAWTEACRASESAQPVISIPKGKTYALGNLTFRGPCTRGLVFELQGTLVSNLRPAAAAAESNSPFTWIQFLFVEKLVINGGGTVDGKGHDWWLCKRHKTCSRNPPMAMGLGFANNTVIQDVKIVNSPRVHLSLFAATQVTVERLTIDAPQDSPNTDGIHMGMCSGILIRNSSIGSGDDCVAMVDGSSDIRIEKSVCGPGHGISIGSLGNNRARVKPVTNVSVDTVAFRNTDNGVRIKTWQGGQGFVRKVSFTNIVMENVRNPIIIDQFYCASSPRSVCRNYSEAVQISDVSYSNIRGSSPSAEGFRFACSSSVPCSGIVVQNVKLSRVAVEPLLPVPPPKHSRRRRPSSPDPKLGSFCNNAHGKVIGEVVPPLTCLKP